jgi:hypothetical protein
MILFKWFAGYPSARGNCGVETENLRNSRYPAHEEPRIIFGYESDTYFFEPIRRIHGINHGDTPKRAGEARRSQRSQIAINAMRGNGRKYTICLLYSGASGTFSQQVHKPARDAQIRQAKPSTSVCHNKRYIPTIPPHRRWFQAAKWAIGTIVAALGLVASITAIWGPPWPMTRAGCCASCTCIVRESRRDLSLAVFLPLEVGIWIQSNSGNSSFRAGAKPQFGTQFCTAKAHCSPVVSNPPVGPE